MNYRQAILALAPMLEDGVVFQSDHFGVDTYHLPNGPTFDANTSRWEVPKARRIDGIKIPKCEDLSKSLIRIEKHNLKAEA